MWHRVFLKWGDIETHSRPNQKFLVSSPFPYWGASGTKPWTKPINHLLPGFTAPWDKTGSTKRSISLTPGTPVRMAYCVRLKVELEPCKMLPITISQQLQNQEHTFITESLWRSSNTSLILATSSALVWQAEQLLCFSTAPHINNP